MLREERRQGGISGTNYNFKILNVLQQILGREHIMFSFSINYITATGRYIFYIFLMEYLICYLIFKIINALVITFRMTTTNLSVKILRYGI